jgi:hypothetical protein
MLAPGEGLSAHYIQMELSAPSCESEKKTRKNNVSEIQAAKVQLLRSIWVLTYHMIQN